MTSDAAEAVLATHRLGTFHHDRLHVMLMTRQRVHRHLNIQADVFLFQCIGRSGRAIR